MSVPIRVDYHTKEPAKIKQIEKFKALKIIKTTEVHYQRCKNINCLHAIRVDENFVKEGSISCPNCGKTNQFSSTECYAEQKIVKINHKTIFSICTAELGKISRGEVITDKFRHCWFYTLGDKTVPIILSDVSSYNQFINNSPDLCWFCIIIDWEANKSIMNYYNKLNFVKLEDILEHRANLQDQLALISSEFRTNSTIEIENKFDECIKPISGTKFESDFVNTLWRAIKEKTAELERYLRFLSTYKNTITNAKVVFMGYAANPDFATLDLYDYLQEALKPNKIGEAKRYYNPKAKQGTTFTWSNYSDALNHAFEADALFVLSTNKIAPTVWKRVVEKRKIKGYFKDVIVDKDMLLLLIKVLGIEEMLSKPLIPVKKPVKKRSTGKNKKSVAL